MLRQPTDHLCSLPCTNYWGKQKNTKIKGKTAEKNIDEAFKLEMIENVARYLLRRRRCGAILFGPLGSLDKTRGNIYFGLIFYAVRATYCNIHIEVRKIPFIQLHRFPSKWQFSHDNSKFHTQMHIFAWNIQILCYLERNEIFFQDKHTLPLFLKAAIKISLKYRYRKDVSTHFRIRRTYLHITTRDEMQLIKTNRRRTNESIFLSFL